MCTVNDECIYQEWLCDGEEDCNDGQDESAAVCGKKQYLLSFQFDMKFCIKRPPSASSLSYILPRTAVVKDQMNLMPEAI